MSGEKEPKEHYPRQLVQLEQKVKQLEFIIDILQSRIGQIASSYELEVAIAKSETALEKMYGEEEAD